MSALSTKPSPQDNWERLSQAERDAAYNNNLAVADSAAWIVERDRAAPLFRAAAKARLDIAYGQGARQKLDLYLGQRGAPCLVFIHGGYWQRNTRESFAHFAEGLLSHGWSVAMPSYTLAPEARLGQIVDEIGMALDCVARLGAEEGFGPIVLSGWSAGAQLTLMQLDHPAVTAGLAISGVYELGPIRDTYLNAALDLTDKEISKLSPLRRPVSSKPLVIAYGADELPALVRDSRALAAQRQAAQAPGVLLPVPGANHFSVLDEIKRPDGLLVHAALDLLNT